MGYHGPYSLGARCGTEALATGLMVFLGEGCLANELLSNTKGQGMGFGWTAFGFGFAFFVSLAIWNGVSAHMNPAYVLGLWLIGEVDAGKPLSFSSSVLCLSYHIINQTMVRTAVLSTFATFLRGLLALSRCTTTWHC